MLSAQLGTEFNAQNYDNIKKVYSIWICMDTNVAASNTITSYEVQPGNIYGEYEFNGGYDLQRAVKKSRLNVIIKKMTMVQFC